MSRSVEHRRARTEPRARNLLASPTAHLVARWRHARAVTSVTLAVMVVGMVPVVPAVPTVHDEPAAGAERPLELTATCPGPHCPYAPPTPVEQGAADDILVRMNLERAAPARDYVDDGAVTPLSPLVPAGPSAEATAQAAAEWEAAQGTVADYAGSPPAGYTYLTGGNAADAGDSAGIDEGIMSSYGHALAMLSAAPTQVAIGTACSSGGTLYVIEEYFDATDAQWETGQAHFHAELSENNVYVQSGGTITTVTDAEGTGPAQDYLPQQPIVAGDGAATDERFATGVDWTCEGAEYPPGPTPASPLAPPVTGIASSPTGGGYALADAAGAVSTHGDTAFHGSAAGLDLDQPVRHLAETPDGGGYWLVAADGGVFAYGDAGFFGSMGGKSLNAPVVGLAPTLDGGGYWLVAADGGVFAYGDAGFFGSMGGKSLNAPVVGLAPTLDGGGYWLVAADGGVFSFGDAAFLGSMGGRALNAPVTGIAASAAGGYWLVAADGGVFAYGGAGFSGSMGGVALTAPVVGITADLTTGGYWLVAADGGVFSFGAPFYGAD
jgi:hypothetical protein